MKHQNISVTGSLNLNGVGVATTSTLNAFTASSDTKVNALIANTGSYATTGSNTFTGSQIIQGTLTAQTLVVQTVTSSVLYTTGSNIIGSSLSNVQQITGSVGITGSLAINGTGAVVGSGTADYVPKFTASGTIGNSQIFDNGTNVGIGTASPAYKLDVVGTARVSGAVTFGNDLNFLATDSAIAFASGAARFFTGGSERMRITSVGNVGIGTTNPETVLQLGRVFGFFQDINSGYLTCNLKSNGNYIVSQFATRIHLDSALGEIKFSTAPSGSADTAATLTERMRITSTGNINLYDQKHQLAFYNAGNFQINFGQYYNGTSQIATNTDGGRLIMVDGMFRFNTFTGGTVNSTVADSERMRITSGGQVGVATTTISSAFNMQVGNNAGVIATTVLRLQNSYLEGTTGYYGAQITAVDNGVDGHNLQFQTRANASSGFSTRMTITTTGNIGAPSGTNIYNASDIRLKQNISKTTYGLDTVSALNPVKFNWVDGFEPSEDGKDMLGFVAQEVQQVIPEAVELFGGDINLNGEIITTPLRVNEKFIIPVLVKAIQELKSENTSLVNRIEALENEIDILKNK
jgi:hypothetical protein